MVDEEVVEVLKQLHKEYSEYQRKEGEGRPPVGIISFLDVVCFFIDQKGLEVFYEPGRTFFNVKE